MISAGKISTSVAGDVSDPFVFFVVVQYPWNFAYFVEAGAGVNQQDGPMKVKCSEKGAGQGDHPHEDDQSAQIDLSFSACVKNSVDDHGTDTAADHVYG